MYVCLYVGKVSCTCSTTSIEVPVMHVMLLGQGFAAILRGLAELTFRERVSLEVSEGGPFPFFFLLCCFGNSGGEASVLFFRL